MLPEQYFNPYGLILANNPGFSRPSFIQFCTYSGSKHNFFKNVGKI